MSESVKKFPDGSKASLDDFRATGSEGYNIRIGESDRQLILLALAELSIACPGFLPALENIALKMDNREPDGQPEMFAGFRRNHSDALAKVLRGEDVPLAPNYATPFSP